MDREKGEKMDNGKKEYKGFANIKGVNEPTVMYGNSKEEILTRLNSWNAARKEQDQFSTCNIGKIDENGKYDNYRKYDIASGRDITNIYLRLPSLEKPEFQKLVQELKGHGAKFNSNKKLWYIAPDNENIKYFEKYIPKILEREKEYTDIHKNPELKRKQIAKKINQQGYQANKGMVHKIQQLNIMTGRENSVKDIADAYKNHVYKDNPEAKNLVEDLVKEFRMQQMEIQL